jgi:hypothetical protein
MKVIIILNFPSTIISEKSKFQFVGDWISVHSEVEWLAAIEYSKTTKVLMMRVHEAQPRATHARSGFTAPRSSRLSSPHTSLAASYPAVVIGSGYGGSILASRLARAGLVRNYIINNASTHAPRSY